MSESRIEKLKETLRGNKSALLMLLLGLALLLAAGSFEGRETEKSKFSEDEQKLCAVLSDMEGTGRTAVLLRTEGKNTAAGAVIVCEGADSAAVRLRVVRAVSAFTGLGSDRIVVMKMKSSGG